MDEWYSHLPEEEPVSLEALGFMPIDEPLLSHLDRKLGYFGDERFVIFCYEPQVDGVLWRDNSSHGFGSGAWWTYLDEVAPLTDLYEVDLGCSKEPGSCVLLLDRLMRRAYFAEREKAERLLQRRQKWRAEV